MSLTFHPLRVAVLEPLTPESVRIILEVPEDLSEVYRYIAGQHVTIRFSVEGPDGEAVELRRSYSLCAPPTEQAPHTLQIAVKRSAPAGFGDYAVRKLAVGDVLEHTTRRAASASSSATARRPT